MTKFEIASGSIADLKVDAIVNAANEQLSNGSGVCGAIFAKAGPGLAEEIASEHEYGCETGDAVTTSAFEMDANYIIHAVAPIYFPLPGIEEQLKSAYRAIFREARDHGVRSIALPSLGTGVYGWNLEYATGIAKTGIIEGLRHYPTIEKVVFSCFTDESAQMYQYMFDTELKYGLDLTPRCPKCGKSAMPITYGMPLESDLADPGFYSGGCIITPGQSSWACRECEIEFA
jgi:O-acetyl-ADP-ribose deacetylase (regulator of RNase III)